MGNRSGHSELPTAEPQAVDEMDEERLISTGGTGGTLLSEPSIYCPRCTRIFSYPVLLPCSHSLCQRCIIPEPSDYTDTRNWASMDGLRDAAERKRRHTAQYFLCPVCCARHRYHPSRMVIMHSLQSMLSSAPTVATPARQTVSETENQLAKNRSPVTDARIDAPFGVTGHSANLSEEEDLKSKQESRIAPCTSKYGLEAMSSASANNSRRNTEIHNSPMINVTYGESSEKVPLLAPSHQFCLTNSAVLTDLMCAICRSIIHRPRFLSCGHTFCAVCLQRLCQFSQHRRAVPAGRRQQFNSQGTRPSASHHDSSLMQINCPTCRSVNIFPLSHLPTSRVIEELSEKARAAKRKEYKSIMPTGSSESFNDNSSDSHTNSYPLLRSNGTMSLSWTHRSREASMSLRACVTFMCFIMLLLVAIAVLSIASFQGWLP